MEGGKEKYSKLNEFLKMQYLYSKIRQEEKRERIKEINEK